MKTAHAAALAAIAFVAGLAFAPSPPAVAKDDAAIRETLEVLCKRFQEGEPGKTLTFMHKHAADEPAAPAVLVSLMAMRDVVCVRK